MAIVTRGTQSTVNGKPFEAGCSTHREAVAAACSHAGHTGIASVGAPGVHTVGAFVFHDFTPKTPWYVEIPDAAFATAKAMRAAVAAGASDAELSKLQRRTGSALASEQATWAQALQVDQPVLDGNGETQAAGSWIVKPEGERSFILSEAEFSDRFRSPRPAEIKAREELLAAVAEAEEEAEEEAEAEADSEEEAAEETTETGDEAATDNEEGAS